MKKALTLILALVMCLSLCACGNNNFENTNTENNTPGTTVPTTTIPTTTVPTTTAYEYQFLIDEEWICIDNSKDTITFGQDGTGLWYGNVMTWSVVGNYLLLTNVAWNSTQQYELVFKDNIWRLVSKNGQVIYVGKSGYDFVYKNDHPGATITCHSGQVVKLTARQISNLHKENSGVFKQEYCGADITFVGTIKRIAIGVVGTVSEDIVEFEEGWYLILRNGQYTDLLMTLGAGDQLEVNTQIYTVSSIYGVQVCGTTKEGGYSGNTLRQTVIKQVVNEN